MKEYRQKEIQHKDKEATVEENLDTPPAWNQVSDLMMETADGRMITEAATFLLLKK